MIATGAFVGWLTDYYLAATLLLLVPLAGWRWIGQPAHRIMAAWIVLVELIVLGVVCAMPFWPKVSLVTAAPREVVAPSPAIDQQPRMAQPPIALVPEVESNQSWGGSYTATPTPSRGSTSAAPTPADLDGTDRPRLSGRRGDRVSVACLGAAATMWLCRRAYPASDALQAELARISSRHTPCAVGPNVSGDCTSPYVLLTLRVRLWRLLGLTRSVRSTTVLTCQADGTRSVPATPRLLLSRHVPNAVAVGVLRPTIILPAALAEGSPPSALCAVLAHEWAHIRNRDLWLLALGRCLLVVLFAHPLFWWLRRAIRGDQELLADAVAAGDHRQDYAEDLLRLIRKTAYPSPLAVSAAMGLWEGSSQLSRRIAMLLDETFRVEPTGSRRWKFRALGVSVLLGVACSLLTLQPARSAGQPTPAGLSGGQAATDNASKSTPVANQEIATKPSSGGEEREFKYSPSYTTQMRAIAGYLLLETASTQEQQGLTKEQQARVREISKTFWTEQESLLTPWCLPSRKERDAAHEKREHARFSAFNQIAATLTPRQMKSLRKLVFRWMVGNDLNYQPRAYLDSIGITAEQWRKLQELHRAMDKRLQRDSVKTTDRLLAVLSPRQSQRIRSEVEQFYRAEHEPTIEKEAEDNSGISFSTLVVIVPKLDAASDDDAAGGGRALPIYEDLSQGVARKTLGLSVDQRKQLQKIADGYRTKAEGPATTAKIAQNARLTAEVRQQIERLLAPQQLTTLKEIVFRYRVVRALADSKVQEKMQFSRQQKESLDRIRWEWDEMGRRNGQESNAKAFALLTPHEQEVLLQERERRESGRSSGKKPMPQPRPKRKQRRRRDNSRTSPLARHADRRKAQRSV